MNIFISGVSSGLGLQLCKESLQHGNAVWGIGRRKFNLDHLKGDVGKNFNYLQCDVTNKQQVKGVFEKMRESAFIPDVVILNAALMNKDISNNEFDHLKFKEVFNVNLYGAINIIDETLPIFQNAGKGIFIGISSLAALRGIVDQKIAYPGSKAALNMVFEAFRLQMDTSNIRFIIINLGPMNSEGGFLKASYEQAGKKVISLIHKKKNINYYPILPFLAISLLRFIPDRLIHKYLIKPKKRLS